MMDKIMKFKQKMDAAEDRLFAIKVNGVSLYWWIMAGAAACGIACWFLTRRVA